MFCKLVVLSVVCGLALADPLPKIPQPPAGLARSSFSYGNDYSTSYLEDDSYSLGDLIVQPEHSSFLAHSLSSLIGYKTSALSLAVDAIGWLVSNAYIVILGSIVTLGFCKLSGKCSLDYELYEPVASFRSLVTPERLVTAERFFLKAVEKYAEERKRSIKK